MAMDIAQAQGQLEQRYSDYLRQKREQSGIRDIASERFSGAFGPQGAGAVVNPADIFSAYRTFSGALPNEAEGLKTEADILSQIASLAQAQGGKAPTIAEQLSAMEQGLKIENGQLVPISGQVGGQMSAAQRQKLLDERADRLAQNLDTSDLDLQLKEAGVLKNTGEKEDIIALIDDILNRDLKPITGNVRLGGVPFLNRTDVNTTKAKIDQLMGYLTLENRQKLRGQGTITDREQKTLEQASTTLGTKAQRTEDYIKELQKLRSGLSEKVGVKEEKDTKADPLGIL